MSLSTEEKDDIKAFLIYEAGESGNVVAEDDIGLITTINDLGSSMRGTSMIFQLIGDSRVYKESLE